MIQDEDRDFCQSRLPQRNPIGEHLYDPKQVLNKVLQYSYLSLLSSTSISSSTASNTYTLLISPKSQIEDADRLLQTHDQQAFQQTTPWIFLLKKRDLLITPPYQIVTSGTIKVLCFFLETQQIIRLTTFSNLELNLK